MKTILIVAVLHLTCLVASAQTLFDIYLKLPAKGALGDEKTRQQMISNYKKGVKTTGSEINYRFDVVDENNGFLSVTGGIEGIWEMCYWNLDDGKKLVAVYYQGCGPVCYIESFKFYHLQDGKLVEQEKNTIIEGYDTLYENFFLDYSEKLKKELKDQEIIATLLFRLPRNGKDIIALFGNEYSKEIYSEFSKGDRMLLKWDNGKFKKDKIYWSK